MSAASRDDVGPRRAARRTHPLLRVLRVVLAAAAAFPLVSLVMWLLMRAFPAPEPWFNVLHLIASLALSGAAALLVADAIERLLRRRAAN